MLRTAKLIHPASTPAFRPTPGASLPGTLASPRTGLSPAGHRELFARLRHDSLLCTHGARAAGRTPGMRFSRTRLTDVLHLRCSATEPARPVGPGRDDEPIEVDQSELVRTTGTLREPPIAPAATMQLGYEHRESHHRVAHDLVERAGRVPETEDTRPSRAGKVEVLHDIFDR